MSKQVFVSLLVIVGWCGWNASLLAAPQIQQWHTTQGSKVLFVAAPELPMVDIALTLDAGSARDGVLPGLSQFTHNLLNTGTAQWDATTIAERFESVGAQFGASVELDRSTIALRSLVDSKFLTPALETFINVVAKPSFPDKDFARLKKQMKVALAEEQQQPSQIAQKAFFKAIYNRHPYAQPINGAVESIQAIQRSDVQQFHQRYFLARNASVAIVGAVTRTQAEQLAEKIIGVLSTGVAANAIAQPLTATKPITDRISFPSQQSHIVIGQLGMARGDPDYFVLYVGNHILGGGGFTSRLMKEIRETRGFAYSVSSYFYPLRVDGPFILGLQTKGDQSKQATELAIATVEKFVKDGPGPAELEIAKKNITGGFPLRVASNGSILDYLSVIAFYDLPLDYLETFNDNIMRVSATDIQRVFSKRLHPKHMSIIIVGGDKASTQNKTY